MEDGCSEEPLAKVALYAFPFLPSPPLSLIPVVIRKVLLEGSEVLLVAPHWLRRLWFTDLVGLFVARPQTDSPSAKGMYYTLNPSGSSWPFGS